ncbi:MAG TPA: pyridoxal 5'-phosphate synthase glutaminase subunit PdxT, partial [Prevotella sp.]
MRIGILALQGAFAEHAQMLRRLGVETFYIRQQADLLLPKQALVLPGGESTVQLKLLTELGMLATVRQQIAAGIPVFGTCAGLILLSKQVDGQPYQGISTMDISTDRNAYGRQLGSFYSEGRVEGIDHDVPMTFIRAPYIREITHPDCKILATVDGKIVAAQQGKQLVTAFHPELDADTSVHEYFLNTI